MHSLQLTSSFGAVVKTKKGRSQASTTLPYSGSCFQCDRHVASTHASLVLFQNSKIFSDDTRSVQGPFR